MASSWPIRGVDFLKPDWRAQELNFRESWAFLAGFLAFKPDRNAQVNGKTERWARQSGSPKLRTNPASAPAKSALS